MSVYLGQLCCAISQDSMVVKPSYSEYGCILVSSQMSFELSDHDLIFQGHLAPDMC